MHKKRIHIFWKNKQIKNILNIHNQTSGSWPRLLQKGLLVFLSSSAASVQSSLEQFGVDRRGCSGGDGGGGGVVGGGVVAGGDGGGGVAVVWVVVVVVES